MTKNFKLEKTDYPSEWEEFDTQVMSKVVEIVETLVIEENFTKENAIEVATRIGYDWVDYFDSEKK